MLHRRLADPTWSPRIGPKVRNNARLQQGIARRPCLKRLTSLTADGVNTTVSGSANRYPSTRIVDSATRHLLDHAARRFEKRTTKPSQLQPAGSVHLDDLPAQQEALSRVFDRAWARSILREAVLRHARAARRGDDSYRRRYRILRLRHQQGKPIREIAATLNEQDVDAVHNAYRRSRREFRTLLRDVVAKHTGAGPESIDAECRRVTELLGS